MVRTSARAVWLASALVAIAACSGNSKQKSPDGLSDGGGQGRGDSGLPVEAPSALRIEPAQILIVDDGVAPSETASVQVIASVDGKEVDVTGQVSWSLTEPDLVTLGAGMITTKGRGGESVLTATLSGVDATASLTVRLEAKIINANAPAGAAGMFGEDTIADDKTSGDKPLLVYPSHETMFPRNLERVTYQWRAGAGLNLFELRFESKVASIRYYTTDKSWLPEPDVWRWLADSHAGSSLTLTVRALAMGAPSKVYSSVPVTLYFSASEVLGALYYWSTGAQGVMRATLASPIATKFFTDPNGPDDTCVSCHTVSRNGKRLAGGYGGEVLRQVSIPDRTLQIPSAEADSGPAYGFGTYNPSASRLLYSNKGKLTLLNAETGAKLSDLALPMGAFASHPDWSPDGKYVAVSYQVGGKTPGNKQVQGTSLARMAVLADDKFGEPEVLVQSTSTTDSLYFPSYSPDSRYIAFVRGTGGSKDNETSVLFLVAAQGGTPIALTRLNERVRHEDGVINIGNSMPTWAPSSSPDLFWLAFSSIRDYGDVLVGTERDQLWGSAIDPALITQNKDPSYPGFWMPFQQLDEGNHRAFWAIDTEQQCPSTTELCDNLDNDCDGIVDEDCCMPVSEVCGNGKDDDCDGTVDDGCICAPKEMCGNMMDDDCDGQDDDTDDDCLVILF